MEQQASGRPKYANTIIFSKKRKKGMDKVCQLKGNTKLVTDGFSSVNTAIDWVNEVKDVIATAVTTAIQKKDNKHALVLT